MSDFKRSAPRDLRRPALRLRKKGIVICFAALALIAALGFTLMAVERGKNAHIRRDMQQMVQEQLDQAIAAYDGIDLRSANVEGDILPAMRKHFYYAQSLDNAVALLYGGEYEMLNDRTYDDFLSAMAEYDRSGKTGQPTTGARKMLDECMEKLKSEINVRFDARGNLVKIQN